MTTLTKTQINNCQNCDSDNVNLYRKTNKITQDWFFVKCEDCETIGEYERTEDEAVYSWNGEDDGTDN